MVSAGRRECFMIVGKAKTFGKKLNVLHQVYNLMSYRRRALFTPSGYILQL